MAVAEIIDELSINHNWVFLRNILPFNNNYSLIFSSPDLNFEAGVFSGCTTYYR